MSKPCAMQQHADYIWNDPNVVLPSSEVAERLGRDSIGIELNEKYVNDLIIPRMEQINPLFAGGKDSP